MIDFFHGTATAMITPFTKEGAVNFDAFGRMIEYQIAGGTDVLLILGTTGEPATMTEEEKEAVMRFSVEKVKGRAKIVFGSGSNSTAHAVEASIKAEALGAEGMRITKREEVAPALEKAIALGRPVVIDCIIDNDDKVFPMMPAGAPLEDTFDADDLEK